MDAVSRCAVNQSWRIMLNVPSTGVDKRAFAVKGMNNEFIGFQIARAGTRICHNWSFIGGSRAVPQPRALSFAPYRKGFCPSASWFMGSQIASNAFTLGTVAVLPFYTLMVLAPNSELTKRSVESNFPYVVLGVAYAYLLYLSWTPDTMRLMFASKYWLPELSGIAKMFSNEMTMSSAWLHLLLVDLFAARQIFFDGMKHKIETRHSVSLCLFFCPVGIVIHEREVAKKNGQSKGLMMRIKNLIGKGGHAQVYRGCLPDGQLIAVKRLMRKEAEEERVGDFLSELGIIAHVNHPNAAHLLGFGVEGGLHLVLRFSPHGSLASVLHGSKEWIGWEIRFKIALGVAEGLRYLHQGCHRRIIHRDIKASNILLTDDYQPQISDFGLAKWLPEQWTHHVVFPIEGTFGYLAPEYFMHGVVNEKTDVFAFGVLLLELITGRRAVDSCRQSLVIWAKPLLDANNTKELVDPTLGNAYDRREMSNAIAVASMCIHHMSTMRPHMDQVLQLLNGDDAPLELNRELKTAVNKPLLFDACDLEDYTCSRYLNDLNRHKQLALEQ